MTVSVSIQDIGGVPPDLHAFGVASGYLGAALGVGMVVPQIVRTLHNRRLAGVSPLSWSLTALACFTWLLYGVRTGEVPQIPGNVLIVGGAAAIVLLVPSRLAARARALRLVTAAVPSVAAAVWAPATVVGLLAFGIGLTSALPQLRTSLRRPAGVPSAVSTSAWLMRCGSQSAWLCYALVLHDLTVTISATFTLAGAILILAVESRRSAAVPVQLRSTEALACPAGR
ncbi:MAG: PQ-loop domain-containing transporter [Jatrophihabitantaceae bacterium]